MQVLQAKAKRPLDLLTLDGGRIAAASSVFGAPGDVEVWEIASGKLVHAERDADEPALSLALPPDGRQLLAAWPGTGVSIIDLSDGDQVLAFEHDRCGFALSRDGTRLLLTPSGDLASELEFWELHAEEPRFRQQWVQDPESRRWFGRPAVSPRNDRVAVAVREETGNRVRHGVQTRDAATGKVLHEIEFGAADPLEQIVFSADGSKVLAHSSGRTVKVFDAATGQPAGELVHPGRPFVTGMAVHPNGTVGCSRNNGTMCLWNLEKQELLRTLDWKLGKLVSVAFSPDGSIGAAGTEDGQVILWDVD